MAPMIVAAAADRFLRRVAHQQRTLGRSERRHCLVQEIAGSDSDPNVARLTGSVEVLPLAGATGERGATGPDPLVGRMGCYRRKSGRCGGGGCPKRQRGSPEPGAFV